MRRIAFFLVPLFFAFCTVSSVLAQALPDPVSAPAETQSQYETEKYAEETSLSKEISDEVKEATSSLAGDLRKVRNIILDGSGDNAFARGMIIALFQPMFLAAMFALGLWSGQMSEKLSMIWVLPIVVYVATFVGAFITIYHSEWKPDLAHENFKFMESLESTDVVTVVVGLLIGGAVGMRLTVIPVLALLVAALAGLTLGFSQTTDLGEHGNSLLPFWVGFGLTGVLVNIFGIGFETFLQSIKMDMVTRWLGLATVALAFFFGMQVI